MIFNKHTILEIYSEEPYKINPNIIMVRLKVKAYDKIFEQRFGMRIDEWELAKKKGYYMG